MFLPTASKVRLGVAFVTVCAAVSVTFGIGSNSLPLSLNDKREIVRQILTAQLSTEDMQRTTFISTANLPPNLNLEPHLILLEPRQLRERSDVEYLVFSKFSVTKVGVTVTVFFVQESGLAPNPRTSIAKSFTYRFRKISGHWVGKLIAGNLGAGSSSDSGPPET
jgi:hypothetical protein